MALPTEVAKEERVHRSDVPTTPTARQLMAYLLNPADLVETTSFLLLRRLIRHYKTLMKVSKL